MLSHGKLDISFFFMAGPKSVLPKQALKHQACVNTVFVHKLKQ